MNCSLSKLRRCRPLLGTFVEITAAGDTAAAVQAAIDEAFAAIGRVQASMSFHDPASELSRVNRAAASGKTVQVSPQIYHVLAFAKALHAGTQGIFDIAAARTQDQGAGTADIELLPDHAVRCLRPLTIDLGGVAKGFAVDCAIEVLRGTGMDSALVNAGGDMRCFGQPQAVCIRHPGMPGRFVPLPDLNDAALATSANSYTACAHFHGRTRGPLRRPFSVSVRARACMMADALTKVVLACGQRSAPLLSEFDADAFMVYPDGRIICWEKEEA